jgi:carbon starvation protein
MGAMAFSTFVFDTLDVSARLGRHLFQELLHIRNQVTAVLGGALTVGIPAIVIVNTPEGSWIKYWTLFGASNQLLAALSLAIVAVWLHEQRKKMIVVVLPLVFMVIMTQTALVSMFFQSVFKLDSISNTVNAVSALALVVLSIFVLQAALKKITRKAKTLS